MTTKTNFVDTDSKLSMMMERRNLSDGTKKTYNAVFREIYELFHVKPSELIRIAKREQKPYIDKETGEYDILDLEDRTVTIYQFKYYNYLKDKKLASTTIKLRLNSFNAFLGEYDIQKPKPINISIKRDRVRDGEIVSWKEVEQSLSLCNGIRNKAIVSFFATTGFRTSDVRKLTIYDLIKACSIYFDENEEKSIENLLSKNPDDIVPCWEIMPTKTDKKSQLCVTFNTPESSKYIWQYLNERIEKYVKKGENGVLGIDEPLFATSTRKHLTSTAIEQLFQRLNKKLGNKKAKNGKYGRIHAHSIRKLFSTTVRRNITQVVINSDKTSEIDIVNIFTGHVPPNKSNSDVYEAIETDSHDSYLRKVYMALIPYLSIQDIEVKDIKTQQYKDLEEKNMALQEKIDAQAVLMQREMDEQQQYYERKIKHLESVNSTLTSDMKDLKRDILKISNEENIKFIREKIYSDEFIDKYDLSSKIMELFLDDVEKTPNIIVTKSYIDELKYRAYNELPEEEQKDKLILKK